MPDQTHITPSHILPAHIRPINFAGIELILELVHLLQEFYADTDLESIVILLCVSDATMRPFMSGAPSAEILQSAKPPDEIRGSISRLMIADKTGLPRETVRRKVSALAERGFVVVDGDDRIRIEQRLNDPQAIASLEQGHRAILRYLARLRQYGLDPAQVAAPP
ncbi:MAG: hypothetical protein JNJ73_14410 [Hyphomonadaceae bacterium]|nr:hypothetical protein [Hyphomonadaceae bacterium]